MVLYIICLCVPFSKNLCFVTLYGSISFVFDGIDPPTSHRFLEVGLQPPKFYFFSKACSSSFMTSLHGLLFKASWIVLGVSLEDKWVTRTWYFDDYLCKDTTFEMGCLVHALIRFLRAIGKFKSLLVSKLGLTFP